MAWVQIASYYARYNTRENQTVVGIYYREGGNSEGDRREAGTPLT